jgi:hypothetical protein
MSKRWYVKKSDELVAVFDTQPDAVEFVAKRNAFSQSGEYYAEELDPTQVWNDEVLGFIEDRE